MREGRGEPDNPYDESVDSAIRDIVGQEGGLIRSGFGSIARGAGQTVTGVGGLVEATGVPGSGAIGEKIQNIGEFVAVDQTQLERENPVVGALGALGEAGGQIGMQFLTAGAGTAGKAGQIAKFAGDQ